MLFNKGKHFNAFKKGIFLYKDGFKVEKESSEESDEESALKSEEIDTKDITDLQT